MPGWRWEAADTGESVDMGPGACWSFEVIDTATFDAEGGIEHAVTLGGASISDLREIVALERLAQLGSKRSWWRRLLHWLTARCRETPTTT